jgi:uncharacterized glyoxalase superfamily protein PhnB
MLNLENLKKQAKQYLRWHREGYYPVAAKIRAGLARFRDTSDVEILRSEFQLADAQELVARERGFEGWQALKRGAHAMTQLSDAPMDENDGRSEEAGQWDGQRDGGEPHLNGTEAQLFVGDVRVACRFYMEKLGFAVAFAYGDPPFYGQVVRDRARLNLRLVCEPVFAGDIREREGLLSATITVASAAEIKRLFLSYQAAGVGFQQTLKKEPWGARTFVVRDPDGNLVLFAGPGE